MHERVLTLPHFYIKNANFYCFFIFTCDKDIVFFESPALFHLFSNKIINKKTILYIKPI